MSISRRQFLRTSGLAAAYAALPVWLSGCGAQAAAQLATESHGSAADTDTATSAPHAEIVHLLNRLSYGPRPGDVARVATLGYDTFLEQQLHPEQIDDDLLDRRLAQYTTLAASNADLLRDYPPGKQRTGAKGRPAQVIVELELASMLRAVQSERQLLEIMVDFWSNHLNIYIGKNQARLFKTSDDRDVIRANALGRFSDLLLASAKSPAMLVYLDNAENVATGVQLGKQVGGLNENYAREVMELHTVGVDGGYSQADVTTVARALTGWTIGRGAAAAKGEFSFVPRLHDNGEKQIAFLDLTLPAGGGVAEGEQLLTRLATHPKTAARLARKLCAAFVSDDPPQALVDRAAQTYLDNGTDIRATLSMILRSAEFKASAGQKVKLPLRALVSAVRATGATVDDPAMLVRTLKGMGQPFFGWQSPNGYPQAGAAWVNTSGMLTRWNAAFALAEGRVRGVTAAPDQLAGGATSVDQQIDQIWQNLFYTTPTADERAALRAYATGGAANSSNVPGFVGLALASPAFQVY